MTTPTCCVPAGQLAPSAARSRRHSTLGTFLRRLPVGPRPPAGSGEPGAAVPGLAAGAGPGEGPLTIDLDSTMCETYGLAKEGARHHGYPGKRGYHPLLAIAAGTGDVLMSRLREGRATPFGAPPTSCVKRWAGCAMVGLQDNSRCGPTAASMPRPGRRLPRDGCPLLHHHPPTRPPQGVD